MRIDGDYKDVVPEVILAYRLREFPGIVRELRERYIGLAPKIDRREQGLVKITFMHSDRAIYVIHERKFIEWRKGRTYKYEGVYYHSEFPIPIEKFGGD